MSPHSPVNISDRNYRDKNKKATPQKSGFFISEEELSQPKPPSSPDA
jgi:hypothetical protein